MFRRLRIPGLVDILRVSEPSTIRSLGEDARLDRRFGGSGALLNRLLTSNLRSVLSIAGKPLPSVSPRDDAARAEAQSALRLKLDATLSAGFDEEAIGDLAGALRGVSGAPHLALAAQQIVGRLFAPNYRATEESWRAAELLDRAARSPLVALAARASGRLGQAQRLLADLVHGDAAGVHATAVAIHTFLRGLAAMRDLLREPGAVARLSTEAALARCLAAPRRVLREA
ncbi:MAG TPA: hypothetical protein VKS78_03945, partial [Roseiarcus sp.]|nr:hypothetical protein [Roseiarcus sp.]